MQGTTAIHESNGLEIAIIGIAGRFPGAGSVAQFWQNLCDGVEAIRPLSDAELRDTGIDPVMPAGTSYVKAASMLEDVELFDAGFFGYTPREAEIMDPQQRLFLECSSEALELAGYDSETYRGRIGVFAGASISTYLLFNLFSHPELMAALGDYQPLIANDKDYLATRVSYKLNLEGPSLVVQTACSTSLVAVHLACQSLIGGECDMALAGGVSIKVPQQAGYLYEEGGILSPDGHCRAFAAGAQGTVSGNGLGIVVLKRLAEAVADGDTIYAVIKGSALNNDGARKVGYTAPRVDGQAQVIRAAHAVAEVDAATISYIEAHGTGTPLGDPIEIAALTQAFRASTPATGFCALGSVKTNIGHLDAAAGVVGLIKTALALTHAQIPPSLHFDAPNPQIDFAGSPFYVNAALHPWPRGTHPRRAGVSSFGIGGTNAHLILEEAPEQQPMGTTRPWHLVVLSAKTRSALETATGNLVAYLQQHPTVELADVAATLQAGRRSFGHRRMVVCATSVDCVQALATPEPARVFTACQETTQRPVVFLFPGTGTQYVDMGRDLYRDEPIFRAEVDHCADLLRARLGLDLRTVLYPDPAERDSAARLLRATEVGMPALFVTEYALAKLWMAWGIQPAAMIGHSLGEYVAACLADVISLEDALTVVALRGRLFTKLPAGAMLAVPLSEEHVRPLLGTDLSLAAINSPSLCMVAGTPAAIDALEQSLTARGLECRRIQIDVAGHSWMVTPILAEFGQGLAQIRHAAPTIPYLSNVTGTWITAADAVDPRYWVKHLRQTVRFGAALQELVRVPENILLEVGPGRSLSTLVRRQPERHIGQAILCSLRHPTEHTGDSAFLLNSLGQLWLAGKQPDWSRLYADERRQRIPLPTYPFERQRYWVEARTGRSGVASPQHAADAHVVTATDEAMPAFSLHARPAMTTTYASPTNSIEQTIATIWQEVLGIAEVGIYDSFFDLGGHSLMATQLLSRLREAFPVDVPLNMLFEEPTIAQLAEIIEQLLVEKIEALPDDEAERLAEAFLQPG